MTSLHCALIRNLLASAFLLAAPAFGAAPIRIGLVGLDTSHVTAFTRVLNDPAHPDHVPGGRIVAAFKGGSPDVHASASRVDGFTAELKKDPTIVFYDSVAELARNVDAVMILSVDGRTHLAQAKEVFPTGKPLFVDKPAAGSLRDGLELFRLARESGTPCFSSSSLRFNTRTVLEQNAVGDLRGAATHGPANYEPHHPDLYWYGIHAVEMLFTALGPGCATVVRTHTADTDVVTGVWTDGRVGSVRGIRNAKGGYGLMLYGTKAIGLHDVKHSYRPLVQEIMKFFQTRTPPVSAEETIAILAFMEAADESKRRGGVPVKVADVIAANSAK